MCCLIADGHYDPSPWLGTTGGSWSSTLTEGILGRQGHWMPAGRGVDGQELPVPWTPADRMRK